MSEMTNDGVFRYLVKGLAAARRNEEPIQAPDDPKHDYYWESGAHLEIVQRLWDQLGKELPVDSRALVFAVPALVHPASRLVLAFAMGTEYALRIPRAVANHRPAGLRTVAKWTGGGTTDVEHECGKDWILGSFADTEIEWCKQAFLEASPGDG